MTFEINVPAILVVMVALGIAASLYFAHSNRDSEFDLTDLITNKNKVDNAKFCQIGAFFISSWVVFYMTLKNALTEWAFGLYMASWVGARAISLIAAMRTKKEEPAP
jgi:hypothetical protein